MSTAMGLHGIPDDILELILLHLDSPICLVRASSTCKRWRHIVAGTVFLQRFRSLHEPPVVCSYRNNRLVKSRPDYEPSPSKSPATIDSRYLSLDFLPVNFKGCWNIRDSRGSVLLLDREYIREAYSRDTDMFVCEPLTRRCQLIPRLMASPAEYRTEAFLLRGAEDIDMSNFRIFYMYQPTGIAGIFTSKTGSWRRLSIYVHGMHHLGFAAGSTYWYNTNWISTVYALDHNTAEYSSFLLMLPDVGNNVDEPFFNICSRLGVTTGRDGKARILFLGADDNLKIFIATNKGSHGGSECVVEKSIQLSPSMLGVHQNCSIVSVETVCTVQIFVSRGSTEPPAWFSLDIETKELQPMTNTSRSTGFPIKLPWPPTMHACTVHS
ncbi:hypothetical protein PR202_ga16138 [Eleusine coracana subsp. coracana]|uniref:F-box domain-containing protein n=1 Tax=Eleusine coracana subsp. coracana TaxID=191504 RepID=A0AAV5CM12_ELECO|nr:hypothetical protein PR202_ga16138 [Eleusine coracana subsp. coracana]